MNKYNWSKIDKLSKKIKSINLLGGKCCRCGESNIFKLSFHHNHKDEKEFQLNNIKGHRWSKIENEIKKCTLLCNNCHMEHHHGEKKSRHQNNKKIYLEIKGIYSCEKCGYDKCSSALHFHHKSEKKFKISDLNRRINTIGDVEDFIIEEINKCEVLCSNCHVIEHSDIEFYERFKEDIHNKSKSIKEINSKLDRDKIYNMFFIEKIKKAEISRKLNCTKSAITKIVNSFEVGDNNKLS